MWDIWRSSLAKALFLDQGQSLFSSKSLVRPDGFVGKKQSAALALPYHRLNRIEQVISRSVRIPEFACCLKIVPGNPKRIFNQCRHRFRHKAKTPSGSTCSFRQALERTGTQQPF
jgi:hypothetical protein